MAKKLSVLKPRRLRNLHFFFSTILKVLWLLILTCSENNVSVVQTPIGKENQI